MNNSLTVQEFQILELLVANFNNENKHVHFLIKDDNLVLSGSFFLYNESNKPCMRKVTYNRQVYELEDLSNLLKDYNLLELIIRHFPPIYDSVGERYNMALSHLPEFLNCITEEKIITACKTISQLNVLKNSNYMFNVKIVNCLDLPQMDFYLLDPDKKYDLLSIVTN